MSYLMGALLKVQREQAAFERLVSEAPVLGLPRADRLRIGQLLPLVGDSDLGELLRRAREPARTLLTVSHVRVAATALGSPQAVRALSEYPLDSPKLLSAAQAHGIDERILAEVAEEIEREGRWRG